MQRWNSVSWNSHVIWIWTTNNQNLFRKRRINLGRTCTFEFSNLYKATKSKPIWYCLKMGVTINQFLELRTKKQTLTSMASWFFTRVPRPFARGKGSLFSNNLEETTEGIFMNLNLAIVFNIESKAQAKLNQLDFIRIKNYCASKEIIKGI